jgi:hypothetical protein
LQEESVVCRKNQSRARRVSDTEAVAESIDARLVSFDGVRGQIGALSSLGYVNDPNMAMSPSFKYRMLMKLGNVYVKLKDTFAGYSVK